MATSEVNLTITIEHTSNIPTAEDIREYVDLELTALMFRHDAVATVTKRSSFVVVFPDNPNPNPGSLFMLYPQAAPE